MTNPALPVRVLGLTMFLAITTFGCAARPVAATAPVAASPVAVTTGDTVAAGQTAAVEAELPFAERAYRAMAARCQADEHDRSASTRNHCVAATNMARTVLHDPRRAEEMMRVRCEKFGAGDVACTLPRPSDDGELSAAR